MQLFHNFVAFRIQIRIDLENRLLYLLGIKNNWSITIRNDFLLSSDLVNECSNVLIKALIEHFFFHLELTFRKSLLLFDNLLNLLFTLCQFNRSFLFLFLDKFLLAFDCFFQFLILLSFFLLFEFVLLGKGIGIDRDKFD